MVSRQTMTLANGIVGVSVLAMPFCFKQCGIVLATTMLIVGAFMTRTVCYFLLKAGTITRRRNYEMLAWHTFGQGGKFIVEISIIGFLIGTLIAFFVVMGDLGPEIVSEIFAVENNSSLRNIIMAALSLFVALPLGLLRNIDSLSSVSTASVLFYLFLVFKVLSEGLGPLFSGSYLDRVDYWRPAGVLQCIPIFSMALSCQTQIFGIYESLPEPSMLKMNEVVKQAVNICTLFYFCVGFFGYIAFCNQSFGGNILMTFSPSASTQLIKTCFLMSIVFGVPLVILPCRNSLNSLIFRRAHMHHSLHDISTNYIPDARLKCLTIGILAFCLVVGILIPNIELVLGLVGSTTGSVICVIFPSIMFIRVTSKKTTERLLAQVLFFIGVVMMIVSTYATLYAAEQAQAKDPVPDLIVPSEIPNILKNLDEKKNNNLKQPEKLDFHAVFNKFQSKSDYRLVSKLTSSTKAAENEVLNIIKQEDTDNLKQKQEELKHNKAPESKSSSRDHQTQNQNAIPADSGILVNSPPEVAKMQQPVQVKDPPESEIQSGIKSKDEGNKMAAESYRVENQAHDDNHKESKDTGVVHEQPIPQVEQKIAADVNKEAGKVPIDDKNVAAVLLKKLEEHEENQKKFLEEQRQVLLELKEHHAQDVERQKVDDVVAADNSNSKVQDTMVEQPVRKGNKLNNDDEKLDVSKHENIIAKVSENLQENGKVEKLEKGLNGDLQVDSDNHRRQQSLRMLPKVSNDVHLGNQSAVNEASASSSKVPIIKPIPVQHSELQQKTKKLVLEKEKAYGQVGSNLSALTSNGNRNGENILDKNLKSQAKSQSIKMNGMNIGANNDAVIDKENINPSNDKIEKKVKKQVDRDI